MSFPPPLPDRSVWYSQLLLLKAKAAFQAIIRNLHMMAILWGLTRPRELLAASAESDKDLLPYYEPVLPGSYPVDLIAGVDLERGETTEKPVLPEKMDIDPPGEFHNPSRARNNVFRGFQCHGLTCFDPRSRPNESTYTIDPIPVENRPNVLTGYSS